jgi:uncharacterized protein (DUF58 family)
LFSFFRHTKNKPEPLPYQKQSATSQHEEDQSISSILKRVRQIEIKTKGLSNHIFSGEYHSAFKGRGMSFSEVREYSFGDDVRSIDWNVTARFKSPFVKVFEEERELTLMLLVDISASSLFGTQKQSKRELITELCAVLSFSAITNNDKVGVIFFSDKIERYIPPKKGRSHILFIIRELLTMTPQPNAQTDITQALKFLNSIMKKKTISFLLSDFICPEYKNALQIAAKRHDLIGIQTYDPGDMNLQNVGLVLAEDFETGQTQWIDTSSKPVQQMYNQRAQANLSQTKNTFIKSGAQLIQVSTVDDYVKKLQVFFKSRI